MVCRIAFHVYYPDLPLHCIPQHAATVETEETERSVAYRYGSSLQQMEEWLALASLEFAISPQLTNPENIPIVTYNIQYMYMYD